MLAIEARAAFPQECCSLRTRLSCAGAAVMENFRLRDQPGLPARLFHPPGPVNLLAVHEERLIQRADLGDRGSSCQHGCTEGMVNLEGGILRVVRSRVTTIETAFVKPRWQHPQVKQRLQHARKPKRAMLQAAVGIAQTRSEQPRAGEGAKSFEQRLRRARADFGVRVEQPDEVGHGSRQQALQHQVVPLHEAEIFARRFELHPGMTLAYQRRRAVCGSVVHDPHFRADGSPRQVLTQRLQTAVEQCANIPGDDDHG